MKIYTKISDIPKDSKLIEIHSHTNKVSPCSSLNYKALVDIYDNSRYDGLIITDHYNIKFDTMYRKNIEFKNPFSYGYKNAAEYSKNKNIKVLFGFEIKFNPEEDDDWIKNSEILVYGANTDFLEKYPDIYKCKNYLEGFNNLREKLEKNYGNNFLMIQAHPFRSDAGIVLPKLTDGIELWNGQEVLYEKKIDLIGDYNKIILAGSDSHTIKGSCLNGVALKEWDYTMEDFIKKIKERKYDLLISEYYE